MERPVKRRVQGPIPSADFLVHNGTDFPGPRVHRILPPLIADFIREAHTNRPVPFLRDGNARTDVIPDPLPALALGYGREDIKTALEPLIEAMRDLDRLVFAVIGGVNTIHDRL